MPSVDMISETQSLSLQQWTRKHTLPCYWTSVSQWSRGALVRRPSVVPRHTSWSVGTLLGIGLKKDPFLMKCDDPIAHAEPAIANHCLPRAMEWLGHLHHHLGRLGEVLELRWEHPRPVRLLRPILPLHNLDAIHDWLASSPPAIEWYSLPNGCGLQGTHMNPGKNLRSQELIDSSRQLSHNEKGSSDRNDC